MNRTIISFLISWLVISLVQLVTPMIEDANAQAYCALRQPHRAQQKLFPNSTMLETFTDQVTEAHRAQVQRELKFTIHHDELGLHTLYAAFTGAGSSRKHVGYIHVRAEVGEWG